jgi:hypothetical protein
MSPLLLGLLVVWGALTVVLIALLIYRSTLSMHEDDQLFLDAAEAHMEREQAEIRTKLSKIAPAVKWLGASSGILILAIAGLAVYEGLHQAVQ